MHMPLPGAGYVLGNQSVLPDITKFIKSVDPDIVGLIEVDTGSIRSRNGESGREDRSRSVHEYLVRNQVRRLNRINQILPIVRKQGNAFMAAARVHGETFHYFDTGIKRLIIELEMKEVGGFSRTSCPSKYRHRHLQLRRLYDLIERNRKTSHCRRRFQYLLGRERDLSVHEGRGTAHRPIVESLADLPQPFAAQGTGLHPVPGGHQTVTDFQVPDVSDSRTTCRSICDFEIG